MTAGTRYSTISLLFLFHSEKKRETCVCVLCSREMRIKSVVCEKDLSFVEFKNFSLLRSILELIVRSLVNIKKERRNLLRWRNSKIFYFFFFLSIFLFNLILISIAIFLFEILWDLRLASSKWSLLILFLLSRIMFIWIDINHRNMQKNDLNREIYDSEKVCELHD